MGILLTRKNKIKLPSKPLMKQQSSQLIPSAPSQRRTIIASLQLQTVSQLTCSKSPAPYSTTPVSPSQPSRHLSKTARFLLHSHQPPSSVSVNRSLHYLRQLSRPKPQSNLARPPHQECDTTRTLSRVCLPARGGLGRQMHRPQPPNRYASPQR